MKPLIGKSLQMKCPIGKSLKAIADESRHHQIYLRSLQMKVLSGEHRVTVADHAEPHVAARLCAVPAARSPLRIIVCTLAWPKLTQGGGATGHVRLGQGGHVRLGQGGCNSTGLLWQHRSHTPSRLDVGSFGL